MLGIPNEATIASFFVHCSINNVVCLQLLIKNKLEKHIYIHIHIYPDFAVGSQKKQLNTTDA